VGGVVKRLSRPAKVLLLLLSLSLVACGGGSLSSKPTPSATESSTEAPTAPAETIASPTPQPPPQAVAVPDGQRILDRDKHLADDIGLRLAGTAREQEAADFIAGQLRDFGYSVSIQEFAISNEAGRQSSLTIHALTDRTFDAVPLGQSASGKVRGPLAPGGKGAAADLGEVRGKIALIARDRTNDSLTFQVKVQNAEAAGATAAIIYNDGPGNFLGNLSGASKIPAVSISQENGQTLIAEIQKGSEEAEVSVSPVGSVTSRNVIARPPGRDCETVSGGHYDSIVGPGASDNGSGTSTVVEIAGVIAQNGHMGSNCFVLFGAEEEGLLGSKFYVQSLDQAAKARLKAMFNYDMVGVGNDGWLLIGNPGLQGRGQSLADSLGIDTRLGSLGSNTSSDHASFVNAGIPALMLYRLTDNLLHTPQDVSSRVRPELLEQAARLGVALLESYNGGG